MVKQGFKVESYINKNIQKGDKVILVDGSGLTVRDNPSYEVFIANKYPGLTQSSIPLDGLEAIVTEVNINNYVATGYNSLYKQDIVIKIGNTEFRTPSGFVTKISRYA